MSLGFLPCVPLVTGWWVVLSAAPCLVHFFHLQFLTFAQVVVGFAGKLVGWMKNSDLFREIPFLECLPLQQSLRRPDIVAMLLQLASAVDDPSGSTSSMAFDSANVSGATLSEDRRTAISDAAGHAVGVSGVSYGTLEWMFTVDKDAIGEEGLHIGVVSHPPPKGDPLATAGWYLLRCRDGSPIVGGVPKDPIFKVRGEGALSFDCYLST